MIDVSNPTIDGTGPAALSICESLLLSLTEAEVIDAAEAKAVLVDAAEAHRGAISTGDQKQIHAAALDILELMIHRGNSVR
ncbi:MAG: hypothetical protein EA356_16610, partial [Geminicoccaceae bacterium]